MAIFRQFGRTLCGNTSGNGSAMEKSVAYKDRPWLACFLIDRSLPSVCLVWPQLISGGGGKHGCVKPLRHAEGVRGTCVWAGGQSANWAALGVAWLIAFAIGIAIYFLPIARLLDSLTE
jgi:hypothetical protein